MALWKLKATTRTNWKYNYFIRHFANVMLFKPGFTPITFPFFEWKLIQNHSLPLVPWLPASPAPVATHRCCISPAPQACGPRWICRRETRGGPALSGAVTPLRPHSHCSSPAPCWCPSRPTLTGGRGVTVPCRQPTSTGQVPLLS